MIRPSFSQLSRALALLTVLLGILPTATHAQPINYLIKASGSAVYFYAMDGKRYVFASESVYKSWYPDFTQIAQINDAQLAAIPLGGNVTYKPGARLIKITTDPRVYAVSRYGRLHWITSEQVAEQLYGAKWNQHVVDVPDSLFVNYVVSYQIDTAVQFNQSQEMAVTHPGDNIAPAGYISPSQPSPYAVAPYNPATVAVTLSAQTAVQHQTVEVTADVQNSILKIKKIEIYNTVQTAPLGVCLDTLTCTYAFTATIPSQPQTFFAVAYDDAGTKLISVDVARPTLTVLQPSGLMQLSLTPQNVSVGSRVSFTSSLTQQQQVTSHKLYALIPGEAEPVMWQNCGSNLSCAGSMPLYRITNFYSEVIASGNTYISQTVGVTVQGGEPPKPVVSVAGYPAEHQVEIRVQAPVGETIGYTLIKDGKTLDAPTLALCTQSTCSITLQINVAGFVTAFTDVGGKYEASNTLTVTP